MGAGASAAAQKPEWKHVYCAMVHGDVKDVKEAMPMVMERATGEVKPDVEGVPAFGVLGEATNFPNDAAKEYMKNKLSWFCLYDDRDAMMKRQGPHDEWCGRFNDYCAHGDLMKDFECSYTGFVDYLGKPGSTTSDNFYMMGSFKCKGEDEVKVAMDTIKAHADDMVANEDGAVGCLLIPPASHDSDMEMVYECEKEDLDKLHVTYLLAFKDTAAWDAHQAKENWGPFLYKLVDQIEDVENDIKIQLWFERAITLTAGSEYKPKAEEKKEEKKEEAPKTEEKTEEAPKDEKKEEGAAEAPKDEKKDFVPPPRALAAAIKKVDKHAIKELKAFKDPPKSVQSVVAAACLILSDKKTETPPAWDQCKKTISAGRFVDDVKNYVNKPSIDFKATAKKLEGIVSQEGFTVEAVEKESKAAAPLCRWVLCINDWCKAAA